MKLLLKLPDLEQKYFASYVRGIIHTQKRKKKTQQTNKKKTKPKTSFFWGL